MDRFQAMVVFVAVADAQGFAAAARKLSMSPPAVTRTISALEQRLGSKLLLRTTRRVRLTDAGQQFLLDARRILADVESAEESVANIHGTPTGHLVVTAPAMFGRIYITPIITAYLQQYDQVTVSSLFVDRVTHLIDEGIDVGLRIGELPDSSLRAIRVGSVSLKTFASPQYLDTFGTPETPQDLQHHRLIASTAGSRAPTPWRYHHRDGEFSVKISPAFTSNTNDSVIAAAVEGYGITRVLSYQAAPQVDAGELVPILEAYRGAPIPVSLVHPLGRNMPVKVRAFMDLAASHLRSTEVLSGH